MTEPRISSFAEFFPYYLGEHRNPTCRRLHFVGTAGFLAVFGVALASAPIRLGPAVLAILAIGALGAIGARLEARRNAAPALLAMVAVGLWIQPWILAGVVWAYAFAWIGHFRVEHNRPATFTYPLWSLLGDFKMWSLMLRGKLWTGDPLDELGLTT